jgi:ABC-type glycerol-3-phosphate transport system substrate-binding protein
MKRRLFFLPLLLAALLVFVFSCKKSGDQAATVDGGGAAVQGALPGQKGYLRKHVNFRWHLNYDWASKTWGEEQVSRYLGEKFNITANMTAPDAIADEVLNLMIVANDLPDVIWMERGGMNVEMSKMGLFYSIDELRAMVGNDWYNENVPAATQKHYAVDGVNYVIPNWVRMGEYGKPGAATGGNHAWMYTTKAYSALGSPQFVTFEDLYKFAVAIRDAKLTNYTGQPIIPVMFNGGPNYGTEFVGTIFLSFGGMYGGWSGWDSISPDGTYGYSWGNPVWRDAVLEANRWFREGLFPATMVSQSQAEFEELQLGGRFGLLYDDHTRDDQNNFRRVIGENDPGNTVEIVRYDIGPRSVVFLPARGLKHTDIVHQVHASLGWNGSFITKNAKEPGRIFELLTYMLTPQGSIDWTLGPQGILWEKLDANGYPILTKSPLDLTAAERTDLGLWEWDLQGHANNVDNAKFAANRGLPPDRRNWVESMQELYFTPNLMLSDEFQNMDVQIDSLSPLGIQRTLIENYFEEMLPQIITAPTAQAAAARYQQVVDFANANGMQEINKVYDAYWRYNCDQQGGSIFKGKF